MRIPHSPVGWLLPFNPHSQGSVPVQLVNSNTPSLERLPPFATKSSNASQTTDAKTQETQLEHEGNSSEPPLIGPTQAQLESVGDENNNSKPKQRTRFACPRDGCGRQYASKAGMQQHLRTHDGAKPFVCGVCGMRFTALFSMRRHKGKFHKQKRKTRKLQ